tara:strand:+ start:37449 stop:37997 length:549 start_codon:yes stop_codon:yes gene_type:complete
VGLCGIVKAPDTSTDDEHYSQRLQTLLTGEIEMNRLIQLFALGISIAFGATAWAAQHAHAADTPMAQKMQKMHGHMQTMQEQMKAIEAAEDPKKRRELMQQHMNSMREGMMMMGKMDQSKKEGMSPNAMQNKMMAMDCKADDAQCQRMQSMQNRQDSMQERMNMMQIMMQQMMEHQSALIDQ